MWCMGEVPSWNSHAYSGMWNGRWILQWIQRSIPCWTHQIHLPPFVGSLKASAESFHSSVYCILNSNSEFITDSIECSSMICRCARLNHLLSTQLERLKWLRVSPFHLQLADFSIRSTVNCHRMEQFMKIHEKPVKSRSRFGFDSENAWWKAFLESQSRW